MKKILFLLMSVILFASCNSCSKSQEGQDVTASDTIAVKDSAVVLNVEHAIAMDRQAMFMKFGENYRWYETEILLPEFMDADNVTSDPEMFVNIFQSIVGDEKTCDTWVWKFQHFKDGTVKKDSIHGFWVENEPLNEEIIKLTYQEAYDKMMSVNFKKPHSRYVTLRNPVGPVTVNTQWIFGNINEQIWVDAVTGECKNSNPAFPDSLGFKMPLGEWP